MMDDIHRTFAQHGLVRAGNDKVLGGVAAGLGRRIGIEPWPSRLLLVLVLLLLLLLPGSQLLVYPALWILMTRWGSRMTRTSRSVSPVVPTGSASTCDEMRPPSAADVVAGQEQGGGQRVDRRC